MPPTPVIDLRDLVSCARCAAPLAIASYDYNGDPSALVCADCAPVGASSVSGVATVTGSAAAPLVGAG